MGKKKGSIDRRDLVCRICGKPASEDSQFYSGLQLCNRHYLQLYRHGRITDGEPKHPKQLQHKCDVCGDTTSGQYRMWHSDDEFNGMEVCGKHYAQLRKHGKLLDTMPSARSQERICCVCGSTEDVIYSKMYNGMYCRRHYDHLYNLGEIKLTTVFDRNAFYIDGSVVHIILRDQKNNDVAETIIDVEDLDNVIQHKWHLNSWGYAENKTKGVLQRYLLNEYDKDKIPDHINRDRLDNRRSNLRLSDKSKNAINAGIRSNNTSGVTGVSWCKYAEEWRAYINSDGKRIELGYFKSLNDAIIARLQAENTYYAGMQPQRHLFEQYGVTLDEE